MTEQTTQPEHERRIRANIARADVLVGAIEAVTVAVEAEPDPGYREYLNTTVRAFLEEERRRANDVHEDYLHKLAALREEGLDEETAALRLTDADLWILPPGQRFDEGLQGPAGVRMWEEAATCARAIAEAVSNGPGSMQMSPALTQLIWDADRRAEEALRRARERERAGS